MGRARADTAGRGRTGAPVAGAPLLERDDELAVLRDAFEAAAGGSGRLVAIEGQAGLGKSSVLAAAAEMAREAGADLLRARGGELEREFPFGVALQLFEPRLAQARAGERDALLDGAAALARPLFDPSEVGGGEPDVLFSRVHGLYWLTSNLAEAGPLVIAIDDVHWSDSPSLRFLLYLAHRLEDSPVALVVALRPEEQGSGSGLVRQLVSNPLAQTVRLAPLSAAGVEQLVRDAFPDCHEAFSSACAEVTGGNPFLLKELLAELAAEGIEPTAASAPRIGSYAPDAVSRSVLIRLLRLPDAASRLARAAAVLGDDAALRHAADLAELDSSLACEAAAALESAGVLEPGEPLRFTHPLVRSAVYGDMPAAERSAAHLRAARLLGRAGEQPERVAAHLLAAPPTGERWVVDALLTAGERAAAKGAPDSALHLLRRALEEPPAADQRAGVLLALGEAEAASGQADAFRHLAEAAELVDDGVSARAAVRFKLGRRLIMAGRFGEAAETFDRALAELNGGDKDLATALEAGFISAARLDVSRRPEALERLERLLQSPPAGSSSTERLLLGTIAFERAISGEARAEVIRLALRAIEGGAILSEDAGDAAGFSGAVIALGWADELDAAEAALTAAVDHARRVGSVLQFARASLFRAFVYFRKGRLLEAIADATVALDNTTLASDVGGPGPSAVLAQALMERGDLEAAGAALDLPDVEARWGGTAPYAYYLEARGRLELSRGDARRALDTFLECGHLLEGLRAPNPAMVAWRSWGAWAANRLGARDQAVELAEEELRLARRFGAPRATAIALRALASLEGGAEALARLREAADLLEGSQARLEQARTLVDLGAALRRDNQRTAAREPLERGLELARICGASALVERGSDELAAAGGRPQRAVLGGVESLTASERRVAEMAAAGLTNREIAQRLFVTVKAVQWHLRNCYRKLSVSSREELPAVLAKGDGGRPTG